MIAAARSLSCLLVAIGAAPAVAQERPRLHDVADALIESFVPARDDPDALVQSLLMTARTHAQSAVSALCIDATSRFLEQLEHPDAAVRALRAYLDARPHGLGEKAAKVLMRRVLRRLGRFDEFDAIDEFGDYASHWIAVGPFGDGGDFYSGEPFPPELWFPAIGTELPGRFGPVSPRALKREPFRRTVALGHPAGREGCYYGLLQVRAAAPNACYAEVVTRSSFELFVGGERHAVVDRHVRPSPGRAYFPLRLARGVNHILIKTTLGSRDSVAVRLIDAAGRAVSGVEEVEQERVLEPDAPGEAELPPAPPTFVDGRRALDAARRQAANAPTLGLAYALISLEQGAVDDGLDALWEIDAAVPDDPRLRLALAAAFSMANDLPSEFRTARARALCDSAAEALPEHHARVLRHAESLQSEDRVEDAIRLLRDELTAGRGGPATFARLHSLYRRLRFQAEAASTADRWRSAHPGDPRPWLAVVEARRRGGDERGALRMLRDALELRPGHAAFLRQAVDLAVALGDRKLAESLLASQHRQAPDGIAARKDRADALHELGANDEALALYAGLATDPDSSATRVRSAGRHLWRGGRREAALSAWRRSLALDGDQHDLRRLVARIAGTEPEFPLIARFERDPESVLADFVPGERERGAPSTLVLDQMIVRYYEDGSRVEQTHQIRRINDLSGVEAHEQADSAARAGELVRLRTIDAAGTSYLPRRVAGTFSMPRLAPGVFVEEVYREYRPAPDGDPWRGPTFRFQDTSEPYVTSELVVILPASHPGTFRLRNFDAAPEVVDLPDGYRAHRFAVHDSPRLESERLRPPPEEIVPVVTYGQDRGFGETARYERARSQFRSRVTAPVAREAARIVEGVVGDVARTRALYDYVHRTIPDGRGTADPTAILLRRQGPRFFLLLAMLRAADVPFLDAAAARSPDPPGSSEPLFLGEDRYDVPAALVRPRDGAPLWLFADAPRYAPIGLVPAGRAGAGVLVFDADGHRLERIPRSAGDSGWAVRCRATLQDDGAAVLATDVEMLGATGYDVAERIRNMPQDRRGLVARGLAAQLFPGWTVERAELASLEPGRRLRADVELRRNGAVQSADGAAFLTLPLPATQMFRRFGDRQERDYPLRVDDLSAERWELVVDPGSHRIARVPEPVRVRSEIVDYQLSFRRDGPRLVVSRAIEIRPGRVEPGSFSQWLALLERIDRAEEQRITLRPPR